MKGLQDLVVCYKDNLIPESAGMVNEIMAYLQSLQRQAQEIESFIQQREAPLSSNISGADLHHEQKKGAPFQFWFVAVVSGKQWLVIGGYIMGGLQLVLSIKKIITHTQLVAEIHRTLGLDQPQFRFELACLYKTHQPTQGVPISDDNEVKIFCGLL
ncbi:uncharacterized protein LOC116106885 isoform X2 [Pistacia vera]|uniref:uncharacterized protein LOC116106885 isoform X2 n=1 Tax=Pistacia vera TaxID=55513 RepID=UPI0012635805|nr:uncharacterized protein LOC116106885 isoform X2 [Pistacia vera]